MIKIIKTGDPIKGTMEGIIKSNIEIASKVTLRAKELSPWITGLLRNSIMWKVAGVEGGHEEGNKIDVQPKENEGYVGSAVEYATWKEFGTRYADARPFLRPAIDLVVKGEAAEAIKKKLNEGMYAHVQRVNVK